MTEHEQMGTVATGARQALPRGKVALGWQASQYFKEKENSRFPCATFSLLNASQPLSRKYLKHHGGQNRTSLQEAVHDTVRSLALQPVPASRPGSALSGCAALTESRDRAPPRIEY